MSTKSPPKPANEFLQEREIPRAPRDHQERADFWFGLWKHQRDVLELWKAEARRLSNVAGTYKRFAIFFLVAWFFTAAELVYILVRK